MRTSSQRGLFSSRGATSLPSFHTRTFCLPSSIDTAASSLTLPFEARKLDSPFKCSRSTTASGHFSPSRSITASLIPNGLFTANTALSLSARTSTLSSLRFVVILNLAGWSWCIAVAGHGGATDDEENGEGNEVGSHATPLAWAVVVARPTPSEVVDYTARAIVFGTPAGQSSPLSGCRPTTLAAGATRAKPTPAGRE